MRFFGKIDQLTVFLVLSITLMLVSFGPDLIFPDRQTKSGLVRYVDAEHYLSIDSGVSVQLQDTIRCTSGRMEIFVSLDGGENYRAVGHEINLAELRNPNLMNYPSSWHWKPPYGDFPECKNLILYVRSSDQKVESRKFYLNAFELSHDLPVLSLTMKQSDIVSDEAGVFVFGEQSWNYQGFYVNWWDRGGNFSQRGATSERACYFQYFENNSLVFESSAGLRISGNATRGFPQKSFQLRSEKRTGTDKFEFNFFGEKGLKKYTSLVVRNSGNDNTETLFADLLMQRLAEGTHVVTQEGSPIVVYINGNYWGIYNLRERIDPYFLAKKSDAKEEDITILEGGEALLDEGSDKERTSFLELIESVEKSSNQDKNFELLGEAIDLFSFADYIVLETFFANGDWPSNNMICFKVKDSKWRWVLKDMDYGLAYSGEQSVNSNLFEKLDKSASVTARLYRALMQTGKFKPLLEKRFQDMLETQLNEENIQVEFDQLKKQFLPEIDDQIRRWRMIDSRQKWEQNCLNNLTFLKKRPAIFLSQLKNLP